jgi:DNA ligase-associated metallophosphoesterase
MEIVIKNHCFTLLPEKCLLHKDYDILFLADLHIGKTNHFRKAGIAVPSSVINAEVRQLINIIDKYNSKQIVFLGDLFHSTYNVSVELIKQVLDNEVDKTFTLVEGNHDIMRKSIYENLGIEVVESILMGEILFTHDAVETEFYNIHGHIHPGYLLSGKGMQKLRLPCFYFGKQKGILPAFGVFTGLYDVERKDEEEIYVIGDGKIFKI